MEVQDKSYPKLEDPKGRKIEHAVILKLVTTDICGSDLHIYNGRFAAPAGIVMGHENTGEVVEVGSHIRYLKRATSARSHSMWHAAPAGTARNATRMSA